MSIDIKYKNILCDRLNTGRDFVFFRLPNDTVWHFDDDPDWKVKTCLYDRYNSELPDATDISYYLDSVARLRNEHLQRGGKTVFSRVIRGCLDPEMSIVDACEAYFEVNKHAFCALVSRKNVGIWMIATPELLLYADKVRFATMALAGSRPAHTVSIWDTKNVKEQAMVTRFICDEWSKLGLDVQASESTTLVSGCIEHICTHIEAPYTKTVEVDKILKITSPTPAVCGLPRDDARQLIDRYETHLRGLYAGYIAVEYGDTTHAYVVLRCARLSADGQFAVYVGGGITADSQPQSELTETELKSSTIIRALRNEI